MGRFPPTASRMPERAPRPIGPETMRTIHSSLTNNMRLGKQKKSDCPAASKRKDNCGNDLRKEKKFEDSFTFCRRAFLPKSRNRYHVNHLRDELP